MNISLDGYYSGPNCELDWHFERWCPDMGMELEKELSKAGSMLLGRKTWAAMSAYWPSKIGDPCCPREDISFAMQMNNRHKIVYSNNLKTADWSNSSIIKGNLETAIRSLKNTGDDKNIIAYGSGQLVQALISLNLVDEFQLWIHPLILGKGKPLFKGNNEQAGLRLMGSKFFTSGVILLRYER